MGLFKKLVERAGGAAPDYDAAIAAALDPGEQLAGWVHGYPLAFAVDTSLRRRTAFGTALNLAGQQRSERAHLGGGSDAMARAVPRDLGHQFTVSISDQRVAFWSFGPHMLEPTPTLITAFGLGEVVSVARTGDWDEFGAHVRFTFADESFVDVAVMEHPMYEPFFAAAAQVS